MVFLGGVSGIGFADVETAGVSTYDSKGLPGRLFLARRCQSDHGAMRSTTRFRLLLDYGLSLDYRDIVSTCVPATTL